VPSTQIVPSIGARAPLPDKEEIDEDMLPMRAAGKRPVPSRTESSVGNGYNPTHDTASSGRVQPNAIVPRASRQSAYGTPPGWTVRMLGGVPRKFAKVEVRLMRDEAERMQRPRPKLTWIGDTEMSETTGVVV
jgi:hypothetical protein